MNTILMIGISARCWWHFVAVETRLDTAIDPSNAYKKSIAMLFAVLPRRYLSPDAIVSHHGQGNIVFIKLGFLIKWIPRLTPEQFMPSAFRPARAI